MSTTDASRRKSSVLRPPHQKHLNPRKAGVIVRGRRSRRRLPVGNWVNWLLVIGGIVCVIMELALGALTGFDLALLGASLAVGGGIGLLTGSAKIGLLAAGVLALLYLAVFRSWLKTKLTVKDQASNVDAVVGKGGLVMVAIFAFLVLGMVALAKGARTVKQYEKGLITRLGKYHGMAPSGLTFIVPFVDDIVRVDMREQVITVPPQKLITKDNVTVEVDAVVYYKVIDPVKSQYEVQDFGYACTTLAQTNLRNLIGDRTLDETLVARDMINTNLRHVLDEATNGWGVKVTRVEVQKSDPPRDITEAMSRQMKAEREKRAAVLEAEGIKQSQILQAEGKKQSEILKAEGDAQARVTRANAEAEAIKLVSTAAETYFKERAEMMRRLEVLNNTLAQNTKYIVPANAGLVNVLGLDAAVQSLPKSSTDAPAPAASGPTGRSI